MRLKASALLAGTDVQHRRLRSIVQGAVSALASRVLGVLVSIISVPLTIGYLGPERYGVWTLLSSLLAWLNLADLGIGKGLTNAIARARGLDRDDLVRAHVSTALLVLSLAAATLGGIVAVAWPYIDWSALFNVKSATARAEVSAAVAATIGLFVVSLPFLIVGVTLTASQRGRAANYWSAVGNITSLVALLIVTRTHGSLTSLVLSVAGASLLVRVLNGAWLFLYYMPALSPSLVNIRKNSVSEIMGVGTQFFVIQVLALIVFHTDNFLVGHYLGASVVPSYSLTYKLFEFTTIVQTTMFGYLSVAYTDAIARRDIAWVRRGFILFLSLSMSCTLLAIVPAVLIARPFIQFWTAGAVQVSTELVWWMAAWSLVNAFCSPIACLLAGASHIKAQVVYSAVSVGANLLISVYLVRRWGVAGAIAGTVIAYVPFICIPAFADAALLLRRLSREM